MNTPKVISKLIDWYFDEGKDRPQDHRLGLGTWVRRLFALYKDSLVTEEELGRSRKAIAIWGPSQSGKSTLLSKYLDDNVDEDGNGSAMQWSEKTPIRFNADPTNPGGCLTWNPWVFGADASACITRFTMRSEVPEPDYPVEIKLASREQVIHAICSGYLSECKLDEGHSKRFWNDESLIEEVKKHTGGTNSSSRQSYDFLFHFVSLLEVMIELKLDRFCGINDHSLEQILEMATKLTDEQKVFDLIQEVFWDSQAPLNNLRSNLDKMASRLEGLKPNKRSPIHCSYDVARLLNDMAAYSRMTGGQDTEGNPLPPCEETRKDIKRISYEIRDGRLLLGLGTGEGLVGQDEDFALLQGIICELIAPIRK